MTQRRRIKHLLTLEERLTIEAEASRTAAKKAKAGIERERLLRRARQAETASRMSEWLSSPGLRLPK